MNKKHFAAMHGAFFVHIFRMERENDDTRKSNGNM